MQPLGPFAHVTDVDHHRVRRGYQARDVPFLDPGTGLGDQLFDGYRELKSRGVARFGLHTMVVSNELNSN